MTLHDFVQKNVPIGGRTTLELGGTASYYVQANSKEEIIGAAQAAHFFNVPILPLGWGSNILVGDGQIPGLVLQVKNKGISVEKKGQKILYRVQAGEDFDHFVEQTTTQNIFGIECLSGIPGTCGATPFQNVGAYGQEVSQTICSVEVLELSSLKVLNLSAQECEFNYRTSLFRKKLGQYIILSVLFELSHEPSFVLYPELQRLIDERYTKSSLKSHQIRSLVLELRKKKSMVYDPKDENHRSVGSFFTNPVLTKKQFEEIVATCFKKNLIAQEEQVPYYQVGTDYKIPAAWLIEKAGFYKGFKIGSIGISSRHALCLVHHGQGTTNELVKFAHLIQEKVLSVLGIFLTPEPIVWSSELHGATHQI